MERRRNGTGAIAALLVGLVLALVPGTAPARDTLDPATIVQATGGYGTVVGSLDAAGIVQATGGYGSVEGLASSTTVQAAGGYGTTAGRANGGWIVRATGGYGTVATSDGSAVTGGADGGSFPWTLAFVVGLVFALAVGTTVMVRRGGPVASA